MYQIIVSEIRKTGNHLFLPGSRTLAMQPCRISALSSADYCLRSRVDEDWGRIAWTGNKQEICRLFDAEQLNAAALAQLSEYTDYRVRFLGRPWMDAAWVCAG